MNRTVVVSQIAWFKSVHSTRASIVQGECIGFTDLKIASNP